MMSRIGSILVLAVILYFMLRAVIQAGARRAAEQAPRSPRPDQAGPAEPRHPDGTGDVIDVEVIEKDNAKI